MSIRSETLDNQLLTKDGSNLYKTIFDTAKRAYQIRNGSRSKIKAEPRDNVVVTALLEVQARVTY